MTETKLEVVYNYNRWTRASGVSKKESGHVTPKRPKIDKSARNPAYDKLLKDAREAKKTFTPKPKRT